MAGLFLVLAVAAALWVAFGSRWWIVRDVAVEVHAPPATKPFAESIVSPAEAQRASGLRVGDRVATLDTAGSESALEELPGVAEATVHRRVTGGVLLELELDEVVAARRTGDSAQLLAADGSEVVRRPAGTVPERLPEVQLASGLPEAEAARALARSLPVLAGLSDTTRKEVRSYTASEAGLSTELADSIVVEWGTSAGARGLSEREAAVRTILQEQAPDPGSTLDASEPGQVVVGAP